MPGLPLAAFLFATAFCAAGAAECGATEYRLEDVPVLSCSGGLGTAHLEFAASSDVRALRCPAEQIASIGRGGGGMTSETAKRMCKVCARPRASRIVEVGDGVLDGRPAELCIA